MKYKILTFISLMYSFSNSDVFHVPSPYATIIDARDAANPGDTILVDYNEFNLNSYVRVNKKLIILGNGHGYGNMTIVNVGNCMAFQCEDNNDSVEIGNFYFKRTVELIDPSWNIIMCLGSTQGGFYIHDCVFDRNGLTANYGGGIYLGCDNYSIPVNHTRSIVKRCVFKDYGVSGGSSRNSTMRNVVIDSCFFNGGCPSINQKWVFKNSVLHNFGEMKIRGDSARVSNISVYGGIGETFDFEAGVSVYRDTIDNITFSNCTHNPICLDGANNCSIKNIVSSYTNGGSTFFISQHDGESWNAISNVKISNVLVFNNYLAITRGINTGMKYDSMFVLSNTPKTIAHLKSTADTMRNSVLSYALNGIDSIDDTLNIRYGFEYSNQLDSGWFGYTKLSKIDSTYGKNFRGTIITNVHTGITGSSVQVRFKVSNSFKHDNGIVDSFLTKNSFYTGDTLQGKLIYKKHSSGTWLVGQIDTGRAGDSLSLSKTGLNNATQYDIAVIINGLSSGTTHMHDTTSVFTLTFGSSSVTIQPVNDTVYTGEIARFYVAATGNPTYQWYKNSTLVPGATNDTLLDTTELNDNNATYYCLVGTIQTNTATLKLRGAQPFLWPSVKTFCYIANMSIVNHGGVTYGNWLASHYDVTIGSTPYKTMDSLCKVHATRSMAYTLATNLISYNRDTDTYGMDIDSLKKWIEANYSGQNTDSILEQCFVHIIDTTFTMTFSPEGGGGSMALYPYDSLNPKMSRLPGSWQKNSDWGMNINNSVYKRYWKEKLAPFYLEYTDGIFNDVQSWFSNIGPETHKILEYSSENVWMDSLRSMTQFCKNTVHEFKPNAKFLINNYKYESDGTYQLYKNADYTYHEAQIFYYFSYGKTKAELDGALKTQDSGTGVLIHHRKQFVEVSPSDSVTLLNRDNIAGLCFYLLAKKNDAYYFSYSGGTVYDHDMSTKAAWFNALTYDFGMPLGKYSVVKVRDPSASNPDSEACTTEIWSRNYSNCKVYLKCRPSGNERYDNATINKIYVNGAYKSIGADGLPIDTIVDTLSLRNWEGAILVPIVLNGTKLTITQQPRDTIISNSGTVNFSVMATGPEIIHYRAFMNGITYADTNRIMLTVDTNNDSSTVYFKVWSAGGDTIWSDNASLRVYQPIVIDILGIYDGFYLKCSQLPYSVDSIKTAELIPGEAAVYYKGTVKDVVLIDKTIKFSPGVPLVWSRNKYRIRLFHKWGYTDFNISVKKPDANGD